MRDLHAIIGLIDEAARWLRTKGTDQWERPWPNRPERDNRVRRGIEAGHTWVVWDESRNVIAATVSMDCEANPKLWSDSERDQPAVYVQRLVVRRDREYVGKGLGAQLIDWAGRRARDEYGAQWIRIDVWTTNKALHGYYKDKGFDLLSCRHDPDYPARALLAKPTKDIREPDDPLFEESRGSPWQVLSHRDFRIYFAGNVCSNLGTWLQNTAQILLAYRLTGSVLAVGLVSCAQFSSPLVLGPWAGVLADRFDRRRLLITTQVISLVVAAGMAWLEFAGLLDQPLLVAGALAIGTAFTFTLPAVSSIIPTLVPATDVKPAMALNAVSFNVGRASAPVIGVGVITFIGFGWAFALNALSFAILTAALAAIRPRPTRRSRQRPRLLDGFRVAARNRRIRLLLVMVATVTIATDPILVLGPAMVRRLGEPDLWTGYFIAALGTGIILGSLLPDRAPSLRRAAKYVGALGAAVIVFALAPSAWLGLLAALGAGVAALLAGATTQTLLLAEAGPQHAGRVMAVWAIAFAGSRPLASLLDGWLAGIRGVTVAGTVLALPALAMWALIVPSVSKLGRSYLAGPPAHGLIKP
ncbi:MAG TPA: MFS transporter [Streptosporangiaceae bacterium]